MIQAEVTYSLAQLQKTMVAYQAASGKDAEQVIREKMGTGKGCLSTELFRSLQRGITPPKGFIRLANVERLKMGGDEGIEIFHARALSIVARKYNIDIFGNIGRKSRTRESSKLRRLGVADPVNNKRSILVDGKRLNAQALAVKTELNLRESSRNFVPHAARLNDNGPLKNDELVGSIAGETLSSFSVSGKDGDWTGKFAAGMYGKLSSEVAGVLLSSRGQHCLAEALQIVEADIQVGIDKYLRKNAERFFGQ
jgi:hypothetical protein